jgi:predicted metal-dependent phosphoesterase TrpH
MAQGSDERRLDLHVHSSYSPDGEMTPAQLVRAAIDRGLSGIALTDHNTTAGIGPAREAALKRPGFLVIPAVEISSAQGHVIALGVSDPIPSGMPVGETVENVLAAGGLPVASHPFRNFTGLDESQIRGARFEAIEVLNGRSPNRKNLRACRLAMSLGLGLSAGSDGHRPVEVGRCCVITESEPAGVDDFLELMRKKKTSTWGRSAGLMEVARTAAKIGRELIRRRGKRI